MHSDRGSKRISQLTTSVSTHQVTRWKIARKLHLIQNWSHSYHLLLSAQNKYTLYVLVFTEYHIYLGTVETAFCCSLNHADSLNLVLLTVNIIIVTISITDRLE